MKSDIASASNRLTLLNAPPSRTIEAAPFIARFYETFVPSFPSKRATVYPPHWLEYVTKVSSPQPVLSQALLAISLTHCGKVQASSTLVMEGRRQYVRSLHLLQMALGSAASYLHDDTLAAVAICVWHELLNPTSTRGPQGWLAHLAGVSRLVEVRGPGRHRTARSRAALEHIRYLLMMRSLLHRRSSFLSEPAWLEGPWQAVEKLLEQQVFDCGLILGAIFERVDCILKEGSSGHVALARQTVEDCLNLEATLQSLQAAYFTQVFTDKPVCGGEGKALDVTRLATRPPSSSRQLLLGVSILGFRLGALDTAGDISEQACPYLGLLESIEVLMAKKRQLATIIVRCVAQYLTTKVGSIGAARLVFALRLASKHLNAQDEDFTHCQKLLEKLGGSAWTLGALVTPSADV